jgi:PEGA domain
MTNRHRIWIVICVALVALVCGEPRIVSAGDAPGSLLIESDPAGASVYVDGRLAGETPVTLPAIAAGVHRVRVVRLGFLENSRLVTVKPGARATLRAQLTDPAPQTAQAAALKIVVVDGEGAVNIIQQKTAVAPVIEVRDRNDQPVAGAIVRFAIEKGHATFNGARMLSVTTDAAGRATAAGLTATSRGALQITASAAFQGQTAAATIAQTTVMTTAEASSIASGGAVGGAGGGGLSHTALAGIIGGAGAAGVLIASKNTSGSTPPNTTPGGTSPGITSRTLSGPVDSQIVVTTVSAGVSCVSTRSISGTMTIQLDQRADGTITGNGSTNGTNTEIAVTGSPLCTGAPSVPFNWGGPLTGTAGNMTIPNQQTTFTSTSPATVTVTNTFGFTGTLSNGVIAGTVTYSTASSGQQNPPFSGTISGSGSTTFPVTLR